MQLYPEITTVCERGHTFKAKNIICTVRVTVQCIALGVLAWTMLMHVLVLTGSTPAILLCMVADL